MEKSKSMVCRMLLVLFTAFLWGGGISAYAEEKPWAKFDSSNGTLTFQYGEKTTLGTDEYWLNERNNNPDWFGKNLNVTKAVFDKSFALARPTSCYKWFWGFSKLTTIEGIENLNTSNVTSMWFMFYECSGLTSLDVSNFNTSNVTNMSFMFFQCSGLKTLDLSNFNTSSVEYMRSMFGLCTNLETIYASDKFVISGLTSDEDSGKGMFLACRKLRGDIACDGANTVDKNYATVDGGYFTDKQYIRPWVKYADGTLTFQYGYKKTLGTDEYLLNEPNSEPGWPKAHKGNVTKAVFDKSFAQASPITCFNWFYDFSKLTTIEGIENLNTSNVTSMFCMFYRCSGLTSLDVSKFNTSNVKNMGYMFSGCSGLTSLDVSNFTTSNVKNMRSMFSGCSGLTSLDLSNFTTSNVADMGFMFSGCSNLETIYASDKFVTTGVTSDSNGYNMFYACAKLVGVIVYDGNKVDKTYATADGGYFTDKEYTRPWVKYADGTLTFQYGYKKTLGTDEYLLNEGRGIPDWNSKKDNVTKAVFDKSFALARPTSCCCWFYNFSNLTTIEGIENLNTSNVTEMSFMFHHCSGLTSLDVSNFNTSNVTDMRSMFYDCSGLTSLGVSNFNTSNVTDMGFMFSVCSDLTSLDVSNFNTSNVTSMGYMFYNCFGLTSLDVSNFNTSNVTEMHNMFCNCSGLTYLDLSSFTTSNVKKMMSMFSGCSGLTSLDVSNFNISNVTEMNYMFYYCSGLNSIYFGDKFDVEKLNSIDNTGMFSNCPAILYCSPLKYESFKNNSVIASAGNAVKPYISINQKAEYGTLCVPVGSSLAEGSFTGFDKLYQVTNADKDKGTVTLAEAKSIEPGVPYVYHRYLEGVDFEGKDDMSVITFDVDENASAAVTSPKNEESMLKGTFESIIAPGGKYILQSDGDFHLVAADNTKLKVGAYRAYLDLSSTEVGGGDEGVGAAKAYRMVFEDGDATGIDRISGEGADKGVFDQADQQPKVYFDLMGRKVNASRKGGVYIVNGKKVVYNK